MGSKQQNKLKRGWPTVKIIACSTITEKGVVDEIIAAGADVFLMKNSDAKDFKKAILELITPGDG